MSYSIYLWPPTQIYHKTLYIKIPPQYCRELILRGGTYIIASLHPSYWVILASKCQFHGIIPGNGAKVKRPETIWRHPRAVNTTLRYISYHKFGHRQIPPPRRDHHKVQAYGVELFLCAQTFTNVSFGSGRLDFQLVRSEALNATTTTTTTQSVSSASSAAARRTHNQYEGLISGQLFTLAHNLDWHAFGVFLQQCLITRSLPKAHYRGLGVNTWIADYSNDNSELEGSFRNYASTLSGLIQSFAFLVHGLHRDGWGKVEIPDPETAETLACVAEGMVARLEGVGEGGGMEFVQVRFNILRRHSENCVTPSKRTAQVGRPPRADPDVAGIGLRAERTQVTNPGCGQDEGNGTQPQAGPMHEMHVLAPPVGTDSASVTSMDPTPQQQQQRPVRRITQRLAALTAAGDLGSNQIGDDSIKTPRNLFFLILYFDDLSITEIQQLMCSDRPPFPVPGTAAAKSHHRASMTGVWIF
ncbi:hypothetical protein QBC44DRAFT_310276 [Cladorrhinum sp. PSN332]|nr:hypothetical protein QBC44DRAFT_310276 [Cladorrhinum sp. PSN332]